MNPSRLFIERPVATSLLMFAILLSGLLGYHFLAVSALPQVEYPIMGGKAVRNVMSQSIVHPPVVLFHLSA